VDRFFRAAYSGETRSRLVAVYAALVLLNGGAWIALLFCGQRYPLLFALGVTAYVLGLRHAVDPDHIAAIDSTTRKLMHDGRRPVGVGFFFSLGHSTIVVVLSALVAVFGVALKHRFGELQWSGMVVGTSVSAAFLFIVAAANLAILLQLLRRGQDAQEAELPGGLLARILRPALNVVRKSSDMYWVGLLFGLGFDTATEVALLGISAASGAGGMPVGYIILLPLLFAAGMSLIDTTEGVAMLGAYGWAYVRPARKLLYNMNMTLFSAAIAFILGGAEIAFLLRSPAAGAISFSTLGYGVLGLFGGSLAVSAYFTHVSS
jgi:high-affinity nickel-transport protein